MRSQAEFELPAFDSNSRELQAAMDVGGLCFAGNWPISAGDHRPLRGRLPPLVTGSSRLKADL